MVKFSPDTSGLTAGMASSEADMGSEELVTNLPVNVDANELRMSSVDNASKRHEYEHVSSNQFVHREAPNKNAYSYDYPDTSPSREYSPRCSSNASKPPVRMWVVKKN